MRNDDTLRWSQGLLVSDHLKGGTKSFLSFLFFRCPETGRTFNSGFTATEEELKRVPLTAVLTLKCETCGAKHLFQVASGEIEHDQR